MRRKCTKWTAEQDAWLRENFPHLGARKCAEHLGLGDKHIVSSRARKFGLYLTKEAKHRIYSERKLGVDKHVRLWVRLGLPVRYHVPEKPYTKVQCVVRNRLRQLDYIVGSPYEREERYVVYYDEQTERNQRMEQYAEKLGFRVVEMEEE